MTPFASLEARRRAWVGPGAALTSLWVPVPPTERGGVGPPGVWMGWVQCCPAQRVPGDFPSRFGSKSEHFCCLCSFQ